VLEETKMNPRNLKLEITESMAMKHVDDVVDLLKSLKQLGVTLAIDDFGTGYSSLSYLRKFPVDALKLDRSFLKDILTSREEVAVVKAIVNVARSLKLTVIAEGIETAEQEQALKRMRCREGQGYLYHSPADAATVERTLLDPRI
jgi:EAL domain-containing protein (putative c-di-GMP-specific phosphodiesterase class I)